MGPKQSSPSVGVRVRSYSGSDLSNSDGRAAILRYYAGGSTGQIGERVQYSSQTPGSFIQSAVIPTGGRRDEPDGQRTLLIGSLPAHLTPHLLGAGFDCPMCSKFVCSDEIDVHLLKCFSKPRLHYNGKNNLPCSRSLSFCPVRSLARSCNLGLSNRAEAIKKYLK
uniref:RING-type E3 ubiquitin transferase n=1 Tax=Cyprinus carpio TaxID=7962 RepID=A0A8C1NYL2_CYPCA